MQHPLLWSDFPRRLQSSHLPWHQTRAPAKRRRMSHRSRARRRLWSGSRPGLRVRSRPWELQCARRAHWECQAARSCQAAGGGTRSWGLAHRHSRNPKGLPPSPSQCVSAWGSTSSRLGAGGEPPATTCSRKCNPTVRMPLCVDCFALLDPAAPASDFFLFRDRREPVRMARRQSRSQARR